MLNIKFRTILLYSKNALFIKKGMSKTKKALKRHWMEKLNKSKKAG